MLNVPLRPFEFPPATASDPINPTTPTRVHQTTAATSSSKPHRHSRQIKSALELLKTLSDQAVTPAERVKGEEGGEEVNEIREEGIIANLASHGWTHQTTTNGIRIFQLDHEADSFVPTPNDPTLRTAALERAKTNASNMTRTGTAGITSPGIGGIGSSTRRGARADEVLPFFRGEGWIEGSWRKEDVAATIASSGARAVWDPRYDSSKSQVVELLSTSDTLLHMHIRGSFVADRDACMVTTRTGDDREGKENVLYVAACSVDDPLVPSTASRTSVHLNGFAIRSLPRPPHFEPPPAPQPTSTETVLSELSPTRPSHRRTKSSLSVLANNNLNFLSPRPPLPSSNPFNSLSVPLHSPLPMPHPPLNQTLSSSTLATSSNDVASEPESAFPFPLTFQSYNAAQASTAAARMYEGMSASNRPGLAVSMLIRASPGYNLPHSMLQQLSVHLPLSISAIGRFLTSHGFAPYLVRTSPRVRLREEEFDTALGKYHASFSVDEGDPDEIRIRFYGGTFGRRFDVECQHVKPGGWRIDYDVPPAPFEDPVLEQNQEELGGPGSGRWKTSVTLNSQRVTETRQRTRFEDSPSVGSPGSVPDETLAMDPALLPGPLGGCTIVIDTTATTLHLPVIVSISRPCADVASQPLARMMRGRSRALAQAAQVALDDNTTLCNSLEEFLECGREGDEQAELYLRGAKMVLRELERATLEEGRASSRMTTSALFGDGGWRGSPRSPNRPLASPRRLGRPPSSLSLRFANS
ncbi:hypothetical protein JCM16303_007082 [Sporobolomyces ruberrimus]